MKLSLFADNMLVYMENPIDSTKNKNTQPNKWIWQSSWIQSQYSEIKGIPVHHQQNCRNRNQEKNPIWYSNKKNKVPRNKPNQGGKNLYSENYTTLKKEIKEDTNLSLIHISEPTRRG